MWLLRGCGSSLSNRFGTETCGTSQAVGVVPIVVGPMASGSTGWAFLVGPLSTVRFQRPNGLLVPCITISAQHGLYCASMLLPSSAICWLVQRFLSDLPFAKQSIFHHLSTRSLGIAPEFFVHCTRSVRMMVPWNSRCLWIERGISPLSQPRGFDLILLFDGFSVPAPSLARSAGCSPKNHPDERRPIPSMCDLSLGLSRPP